MALNKSILLGRLVKDVEVKQVKENSSVASFTIAVDKRFRPKDESQPTADFIPIVAWNKLGEFASKYFHKGKQIIVCGAIETFSWEKEDGTKVYGFHVKAEELSFAGSDKREGGSDTSANNANENSNNEFSDDDFPVETDFKDDLPF